jgi:hypothetical protein
MARNQNRVVDKTFLSLDLAEERGLIHRDYLAHCLRWSHVVKFLNRGHAYKEAMVLDVGCGKEMPLAKTLYVNKMSPRSYVGVDCNDFDIPQMLIGKKIPITVWPKTDFCALDPPDVGLPNPDDWDPVTNSPQSYILPNILTCFEVLEHITPEHCRRMLIKFKELTSKDCHYFISTPCWNGSAAENHINEMTFQALGGLIEDLGYKVEGVYGTFASISDYETELGNLTLTDKATGRELPAVDVRGVFSALRNYYDTNVLSVIFAPLFPNKSRNALWHLTKKTGDDAAQDRLFSALENATTPWSQSPSWRELNDVQAIRG